MQYLNTIIQGDCIEVMHQLPDNSIDLICTDPPYQFVEGGLIGGKFKDGKQIDVYKNIDTNIGSSFDPKQFLDVIKRIMKKVNMYIRTNKNLIKDYIQRADNNGFSFDILVRIKNNPVPTFNGKYLTDKEYCIFIREGGATFNVQKGEYDKYRSRYKDSIGNSEYNHPTIKPLRMIKRQIEISSNKGDIVLDPYLGSGTTAVATKELGRKRIGIEKNGKYCMIAEGRLKTASESLF